MGFKKTENSNLIYEFDFVPTKLMPQTFEECGYESCYAVEGPNGERAPVLFEFQGERHGNYAISFGFVDKRTATAGDTSSDMCVCINAPLLATFDKLFKDSEPEDCDFDPWGTDTLAKEGKTFDIIPIDEATRYLEQEKIPHFGFDVLKEKTK